MSDDDIREPERAVAPFAVYDRQATGIYAGLCRATQWSCRSIPQMVHQFADWPSAEEVLDLVRKNDARIDEPFLLRLLSDPQCPPAVCHAIAQNRRFTAIYEVRRRLVAHRATPQGEAARLVYYLYWFDLLRLSTEMQVPTTT